MLGRPYKLAVWVAMAPLFGCLAQPSKRAIEEPPPRTETSNDFIRNIRPLLADRCFACHGPDRDTRYADLRLDTREGLFELRASGAVVAPGRPEDSLLYQRISATDESRRMPPRNALKGLSAAEIELLRSWIANGAPWGAHWAFSAPRRPVVPALGDWGRNPIDAFVLAKLQENGLEPSPQAPPSALLRRVTFDLTGLPPTLEALDALEADPSGEYESAVERLLGSPQYGEHMAVGWLDAARYSDTHGYHVDQERPAWPWRDWVIDAFNRNMPFDEFTVAQLAGDLVSGSTPQDRLATAFNRHHPISIEAGIVLEEYRVDYVADRVATVGSAWMGLSLACARCHDHKFDPILQRDFYKLFACFNNIAESGKGNENDYAPRLVVESPLQAPGLAAARAELAALESQLASVEASQQAWERRLEQGSPLAWTALTPTEVLGEGTSLVIEPEGSVLARAPSPGTSVYTATFAMPEGAVHAIRLDVLTEASLPSGGPGRSISGNFVLSEFEVLAGTAQTPVPFASAVADYTQPGFAAAHAVDGSDATGWAVGGGGNRDHYVVFLPKFVLNGSDQTSDGGPMQVRLKQLHGGRHTIGRFRISVSSNPDAAAPWAVLAKPAAERTDAERQALRDHFWAHHVEPADRAAGVRARFLHERIEKLTETPASLVMDEMASARPAYILNRGSYDQPGDPVECGVPPAVLPQKQSFRKDRLGLAEWLLDPEHPLTARVAVNRYWQHYFGRGLVATSDDFGSQGQAPSHPELLDWLAVEFIESGWDIKHIQRLIVESATYRQASVRTSAATEADPDNTWLSYFPSQRLGAEAIRDRALSVSGLLVQDVGGPSVYPYQPAGLWIEQNDLSGYSLVYPVQTGLHLYRRSLYTFWKRTLPPPTMSLFDAPSREVSSVRRSQSNTPLQALALINDVQAIEAARVLAARVMRAESTVSNRLTMAFRLVTSRRPTADELSTLSTLYEEAVAAYRLDPIRAQTLVHVGDRRPDLSLEAAEHAAWTEVSRVLLNLGESIRKG